MENQNEIWKDIIGYEGLYLVSNLGRVKSLDRILIDKRNRRKLYKGVDISLAKTKTGYLFVGLKKVGFINQQYIHRLVATHFIQNPDNKPTVNHIDGNKSNNSVNNLEWATRSENTKHAYDTGLIIGGEKGIWSKLTEKQVLEIRENKLNLMFKDLAVIYNVTPSTIGSIVHRKTWINI